MATTYPVFRTNTNSHYMTADQKFLGCAIGKPLPKRGEIVEGGPEFDSEGNRTGLAQVFCYRCHRGSRR